MEQGHIIDIKKLLEDVDRIKKEYPEISRSIREKRYTIGDIGLQSRWANHWEEKGLFFQTKVKEKWHMLDLIDSLWMKLIIKLRKFNASLTLIRSLKDNLTLSPFDHFDEEHKQVLRQTLLSLAGEDKKDQVEVYMASQSYAEDMASLKLNMLELMLLDMLVFRNEYRILLNHNGEYMVIKPIFHEYLKNNALYTDLSRRAHISISLNELLSELVGDIGLADAVNDFQILTQQEARIIEAIREEGVKEVSVRFNRNDKEPELLCVTKEESIEKSNRIRDMILRGGYHDITLKTHKGEVAICENTRKEKLI